MTPELQSVLDRLELVERQARGWKLLVWVSLLLAAAALAMPMLRPRTQPAAVRAKFAVVEANRFLLRDLQGNVAGGLETTADGTSRLVLGGGTAGAIGAAAILETQRNGVAHLTLRGTDGQVRAALLGTRTPSFTLATEGQRPGAMVMTNDLGTGAILLVDALGRPRFKAP